MSSTCVLNIQKRTLIASGTWQRRVPTPLRCIQLCHRSQSLHIFTTAGVFCVWKKKNKTGFFISAVVKADSNSRSFQRVRSFWCQPVIKEVKHLPENWFERRWFPCSLSAQLSTQEDAWKENANAFGRNCLAQMRRLLVWLHNEA